MKKLLILALALSAATATPAVASYTNNQWQNGWPQHANMTNSWCGQNVPERNKWAYLYTGYCGG